MTIDFKSPVEPKSNEELIEILNLPRHNIDIMNWQSEALKELGKRDVGIDIVGKDKDNHNIYGQVSPQKSPTLTRYGWCGECQEAGYSECQGHG